MGTFLQRRGYKVKVFNSIDFSKSMHYNPLSYIHNEADILKFVDTLIANTKGEGKEGDPFWTKAETLLYCALIAYIIFEAPAEDRNINTLVDMISGMDVKEDDESYMNAVDYMFKGLEKRKPDCFAVKQYKKYKLASGKTAKSILISCGSRLAPFDIPQLREIMSYDELELDRIGDRKTAVFFTISDTTPTHVFQQQRTAHEYMKKYGVQHEAWGPFAEGKKSCFTNPVLVGIGEKYGKTAAQTALRFLIQSDVVVIPKSTHKERMEQNLDVFDFSLSEADMDAIRALDEGKSLFFDHYDPATVEMLTNMGKTRIL